MVRWTPEMTDRFRGLLRSKMSLQRIADTLSREFDCRLTRNAMIGKANRLGISISIVDRIVARKPRRPKAAVPLIPIDEAPLDLGPVEPLLEEQPPRMIGIIELSWNTCRYPHGDEAPYLYCGEAVHHGAYCQEHARLCYIQLRR